jgi:DNA-binding beta-propeller fold protein YncE
MADLFSVSDIVQVPLQMILQRDSIVCMRYQTISRLIISVVSIFTILIAVISPGQAAPPLNGRFIFAVEQNAQIYIYDIAAGHRLVDGFLPPGAVKEVRGVCASAATGLLYISYLGDNRAGHIMAIDMSTHVAKWYGVYDQSVDRLTCTPDGTRLYVPSNEFLRTPNVMVVDGLNGKKLGVIAAPTRSHDALANVSGSRVYIETKSTNMMSVIDVASGKLTPIGPLAGIPGPFTFDATETRLFSNVFGLNGFQITDIHSGRSLETVTIPGQTPGTGGPTGFLQNHGIALSPAGKEIWVTDGPATGGSLVHVFDVSKSPAVQVATVDVDVPCPHWLTFGINGDYAYVAGPHRSQREKPEGSCRQIEGQPTSVIDVVTRKVVGRIAASDGYVFEAVMDHGRVTAVGSQYGQGTR